ncbi:MAG TPA: hypothetical protein PKE32_05745, partial [Miltoncostaeaceae bacterium]|nr:hypothetical protein [Miltoncostaeaceae bacterium]
MKPQEALARVLSATGVALPRGVLGEETIRLAVALGGDDVDEIARLVDAAAAVHWPLLQGPMGAALARGVRAAGDDQAEAFDLVGAWAADPDPGNPFARALVVRAAGELANAWERSREILRAAEDAVAVGDVAATARASAAAGAVAVVLCDLDAEDFEPEIAAYLGGDRDEAAVEELARSTGDRELRQWARELLLGLDAPDAPRALEALRGLAGGGPTGGPGAGLVG